MHHTPVIPLRSARPWRRFLLGSLLFFVASVSQAASFAVTPTNATLNLAAGESGLQGFTTSNPVGSFLEAIILSGPGSVSASTQSGTISFSTVGPINATTDDEFVTTIQVNDRFGPMGTIDSSVIVTVTTRITGPDPLSANPTSLSLPGNAGATVTGSVQISGGTLPYSVNADNGAATIDASGKLDYSHTIPSSASGALNDILHVSDNRGRQLDVPVTISVNQIPPLTANPSSLALTGAPGATVTGSALISGGVPPYSASASSGMASVDASGNLSYQRSLDASASGMISDTISVSDSAGNAASIAVTISVTAPPVPPGNDAPLSLSPGAPSSSALPGFPFNQDLSIVGGVPPFNLSLSSGPGSVSPSVVSSNTTVTYTTPIDTNQPTPSIINAEVTVTDATGATAKSTITINVGPLSSRGDLTVNQQNLGAAVDTLCPKLAVTDNLNANQQNLLARCSELEANAGGGNITSSLDVLNNEEGLAPGRLATEAGNTQQTNVQTRGAQLRVAGAYRTPGVSVAGLSMGLDGNALTGGILDSMLQAASGGSAGDNEAFSRLGVYINGNVDFGDKDGTDKESGFDFNTKGLTAGVDYWFTDQLNLGAALGYTNTDVDIDGNGGGINNDGYSLSLYGNWLGGENWYLEGLASVARYDFDSTRNIRYQIVNLVREKAKADYNGDEATLALGGGYDTRVRSLDLNLFGRLTYSHIDLDSYQERGANGLGLRVDDQEVKSFVSTLGIVISRALSYTSGVFVPQLRVEWEHEFEDGPEALRARFVSDPNNTGFTIDTDNPDRNYARVGLGVSAVFPNGRSAFINYDTTLGLKDLEEHNITAGFRMEF